MTKTHKQSQDLFRMIADPGLYQQQEADEGIRSELVRIKEALDHISQHAETFDYGARNHIQSVAADIEDQTIQLADHLDDMMTKRSAVSANNP